MINSSSNRTKKKVQETDCYRLQKYVKCFTIRTTIMMCFIKNIISNSLSTHLESFWKTYQYVIIR